MRRTVWVVLGLVSSLLAAPSEGVARPGSQAAADPVHTIAVTGAGVATYPDFDPGVSRYGVTTTEATAGTVTVTAATSDPDGQVLINGRPAPGGTRTFSGLEAGDEIAVFILDSAGTARHSYIYLPALFPALERVTPDPASGALAPGLVMLTISEWVRPLDPLDPTDRLAFFETAVDVNGVPGYARESVRELDFKLQPDGHYSVSRTTTAPGRTGEDLVVLDAAMEPIATRRTQGLVNTDGHDSILLLDGTLWLMAYEPNADTGLLDSIIQRIDPDGSVGFQWDSSQVAAETLDTWDNDYAHINSFQIMSDGDLLVSFRHLSAVYKIATSERDGFGVGDVVWKLGGRDSDFTMTDEEGDPDGGPCAQHTARELPNGNIVMFDNGSWDAFGATDPMCLDPADPSGPPVQRLQTRVVEWELDVDAGTAEVVRSYAPPGRFAIFAGSSQPLANGNTMIGWAEETSALATELDADGGVLWEIRDPRPTYPFFTYRAHKAEVPDVTAPIVQAIEMASPIVEGADATVTYGCQDEGGSSLQTCAGPVASGALLDTRDPGKHTFTVIATDGAGNTTTRTRLYHVKPVTKPDAMLRSTGERSGTRRWTGDNVFGGPPVAQRVRATVTRVGARAVAVVRLENDGAVPTRIRYKVRGSSSRFDVRGWHVDGGVTPMLQSGEEWEFRIRVIRLPSARPGDRIIVRIPARSTAVPVRRDAASFKVTAVRA